MLSTSKGEKMKCHKCNQSLELFHSTADKLRKQGFRDRYIQLLLWCPACGATYYVDSKLTKYFDDEGD